MPAQLTTRAQVNGYRFLLRRLDHALVRRDVRMLHDPMRSQLRSLVVGAILGVLVVAGAAILAFLRPQGAIGDAHIVAGKDSGALYVVIRDGEKGDRLHPVLNLASARLITGTAESPKSVKDAKLGSMSRGPMLGIPGAPAALPGSGQGARSEWALCDAVQLSSSGSATGAGVHTTVLAGHTHLGARVRAVGRDEALLVRGGDKTIGDKTYLVYDGKRAEVDPRNSVMARALNLSAYQPRSASPGLLAATIAVPIVAPPQIPGAGQQGPGKLSGVPIGGIIAVSTLTHGARPDLYVVLAEGVQPVSAFAAQVIRTADSYGMSEIATVPPDVLDGVPVVHALPIEHFPVDAPEILAAEDAPVACIAWSKAPGTGPAARASATDGPADRAVATLLAGTELPLSEAARPVRLATADGTGDRVDQVYIPPSTGEFVQVTGIDAGSPRRGSLFYIADSGIRYGIPDAETAAALGLEKDPRLAPWVIVGQLVPGPTLAKQEALVSRDTLPTGR
ncbi:type VII secretion protein EccB [Nocardia sp. NPDC051787]|uniref:type VII secretion protein EccB n=1 Tax=Nocardia sp. NPDC051787 TaxID=3155415 RepID=UPI0034355F5E